MAKKKQQQQRPSHPSVERARMIANLMDSAFTIPIIRKKVGLDPLLGMLPIGGDVVAFLISLYIVWVAFELRLPNAVIVRMSVNIVMDLLVGALPVVGDIADMFWKANKLNFKLLEEAYQTHGIGPKYEAGASQPTVDVVAEPI